MALVRYVLERPALGPLRRWAGTRLQLTHHAKVVPAADARRMLTLDRAVELHDLERVVPWAQARDIVLDADPRIAVTECACRAVSESRGTRSGHSCGPLEVCIYVGDPIASFVVEKQHGKGRFISRDEALAVIDAAASRGNLHTLWFKDAAAGRMYAVCNCCRECCVGLQSQREGFSPLAGSGYLAVSDPVRCTACGVCVESCAFDALALDEEDGSGPAALRVSSDRCLGCGVCVSTCPEAALALARRSDGIEPVPWTASRPEDPLA
jgi:ferredoxin